MARMFRLLDAEQRQSDRFIEARGRIKVADEQRQFTKINGHGRC